MSDRPRSILDIEGILRDSAARLTREFWQDQQIPTGIHDRIREPKTPATVRVVANGK